MSEYKPKHPLTQLSMEWLQDPKNPYAIPTEMPAAPEGYRASWRERLRTWWARLRGRREFVGVFPTIPVSQKSDSYFTYDRGSDA